MRAIVVHPAFKALILEGKKTAIMQQENFLRDEKVVFMCREETNPPSDQPFATAVIKEGAILQVNPNNESMKRQVQMARGWQWIPLMRETINKVIWNEGFAHPDDFWNNLDKRPKKVLIVTQLYFDQVQPIKEPAKFQFK